MFGLPNGVRSRWKPTVPGSGLSMRKLTLADSTPKFRSGYIAAKSGDCGPPIRPKAGRRDIQIGDNRAVADVFLGR